MEANRVHDVIVIGAGISGLSAAKVLRDKDVDVVVLEARDRVGGRTWTVKNDKCGWVDLGGAYIGRSQNHVLRLIKEFGLQLYSVNEKERIVLYEDGKRHLFHNDELPNVGLMDKLDFVHLVRMLDEMGQEISLLEPWKGRHAEEWDRVTVGHFLETQIHSTLVKKFLQSFVSILVAGEFYESSLLSFLWYVKQCHGTMSALSTTNGGQEFKVNGGTNQISECLARKIGMDRIRFSDPVYYLEQSDEKVIVKTLSGEIYEAKYVIMAIPPVVQQKIHFSPPLPTMRNQLLQRTPMGSVIKCIVYYERAFWRENNMCGTLCFLGNDLADPIVYTLDDTKEDGSHPAIIGFITGEKARRLEHLSRDERCNLICESYARAFACDEATNPIHYEEQNWMQEQYSGGCYTMICPPGFLTRYGPYLRRPINRMYFAGTEVATVWSGYMNGAVQAGELAARQVLAKLDKISIFEVLVDEPVSQEYPPVQFPTTWLQNHIPSASLVSKCLKWSGVLLATITAFLFVHHKHQGLCFGK